MSEFKFQDDLGLDKPEENKPATPPAPAPPAASQLPETPVAPVAPAAPVASSTPAAAPGAFSFAVSDEPAPTVAPPAKPAAPKPATSATPTAPATPVAATPSTPVAPTPPAATAAASPSTPVVPPLPDLSSLKATPPTVNPAAPKPAATNAPAPPRPAPQTPSAPAQSAPPAAPTAPRGPQAPNQAAPQAPNQPALSRSPQGGQPPQSARPTQGAPNTQARAPQNPATPRPAQGTPTAPSSAPVAPGGPANPAARGSQAPQAPNPPSASGPRPPQPPGSAPATAPKPPAPPSSAPSGPQGAANQVAAYAAANVQDEQRETSGLQKALWSLDGLVDRFGDYLNYVLYAGGAGALICLLFLAPKLFGGKTTAIEVGSKLMSNINTASSVLGFMLILVAIGGMAAIWHQKGAGIAMTVLGVLVYFGIPFFLPAQFGIYAPPKNVALAAYASARLIDACHIGGIGIAVVGLLKYLIEVILWVLEMPDRMMQKANVGTGQQLDAAQQRKAQNANALSPCWSLPFCREVIRKQCPAFLARKTCWKFKRGCYCDDEMIARIIRGESIEKIKAPTKMSQLRKPPCGRCYIYMEHQSHKFRLISPLTIPLAVVIMVALWNPFGQAFRPVYLKVDDMQKNLKFFQTPNPIGASDADQKAVKDLGAVDQEKSLAFTQWFLGLILGFLLLIYISKFMEWAVFEAKL